MLLLSTEEPRFWATLSTELKKPEALLVSDGRPAFDGVPSRDMSSPRAVASVMAAMLALLSLTSEAVGPTWLRGGVPMPGPTTRVGLSMTTVGVTVPHVLSLARPRAASFGGVVLPPRSSGGATFCAAPLSCGSVTLLRLSVDTFWWSCSRDPATALPAGEIVDAPGAGRDVLPFLVASDSLFASCIVLESFKRFDDIDAILQGDAVCAFVPTTSRLRGPIDLWTSPVGDNHRRMG